MKKLLLLGCLLAFSAPAFGSSHHHHHKIHQHKAKIHQHVKIRNGTPNHRRAGT